MKQYIDKSALVAEIERLKSVQLSIFSRGETEESCYDALSCISVYNEILSFIDTLEVKEVQEETESIWHDANQQPTMYRKYLVRYSDGRVSGSWERHDNGFIPWKDVVKEHGFTHWCYIEDLVKL